MSEKPNFQPDDSNTLVGQMTAAKVAWIQLGHDLLDEGQKIIDWFRAHRV